MLHNQIIFSLDYELFFGSQAGSVERCIIEPTYQMAEIVERFGASLSLFVDAGYLCRLEQQAGEYPVLGADLEKVTAQLRALNARGHDIQLHIHPHWEDCQFDGEHWQIDVSRYKLHDFSADQQADIVARYKQVLEALSDHPVFAYRAGGWCIQPFNEIRLALENENIWLDSTVFEGGVSEDPVNGFDFRGMPAKKDWRFDDDPLLDADNGFFFEVPISSYPLSPLFYWEMAVRKKLGGSRYQPFGDGVVKGNNAGYYLTRLFSQAVSPVSVDGIKSRMITKAYKKYASEGARGVFNIMGHPKSLTPYSLEQIERFLQSVDKETAFITFQNLSYLNDTQARHTQDAPTES